MHLDVPYLYPAINPQFFRQDVHPSSTLSLLLHCMNTPSLSIHSYMTSIKCPCFKMLQCGFTNEQRFHSVVSLEDDPLRPSSRIQPG